jgi:hypothetical protein
LGLQGKNYQQIKTVFKDVAHILIKSNICLSKQRIWVASKIYKNKIDEQRQEWKFLQFY